VSDTGVGIPEKDIGKIFDPFYTTKSVGSGTGLSLNTVYNIITVHGGTISVASTPGEGTAFTIQLPLAQ
jgi:signal transduction histidine kinase